MCDQTEVSYLENDVVWVKIGPIWWPGVVKDLEKDEEGQEILAGFKKKPIAVVKFFQEDNYEFVKNLEHIYHYSCRRKDEFIKKGLDKFRTGASHMKKFPDDVTTAESLTNGDINIINDPKFFPEKKESYSEIFGSGKKKTKKESDISPKVKSKAKTTVTPYRPITHQRFINKVLHGESDHKVKTLIQSNASPDDGTAKNLYKCHVCKFETSRVNVIVAHHRLSHSPKNSINWTGSDSKLVRKKPIFKSRKVKSKKLFESSKDDISDKEDEPEKKKSPKNKVSKEKPKTPTKNEAASVSPTKRKNKEDNSGSSEIKKPRFTDVLLADWNEDEEEDKQQESLNESVVDTDVKEKESKSENVSDETTEIPSSPSEKKNQREKMSCFDFDEEEEGFIGMSNANTYGRKIPRVIPVKDKSELGMDLDIDDLFKKKNDGESENSQDSFGNSDEPNKAEAEIEKEDEDPDKEKKGKAGKRRRSRASKDEEIKVNSEDSLALRRPRRLGAKKSYLNEVIEKIDEQSDVNEKKDIVLEKDSTKIDVVKPKEESGSSSRRKQDFKHTMDGDREEVIYSEIVTSEQKSKTAVEKKTRTPKDSRRRTSEDLTAQIDNLLEETKVSSVPAVSDHSSTKNENLEKSDSGHQGNTTSFSFDYLPTEQSGKKTGKSKTEVKSISRMFSDSIPSSDMISDSTGDSEVAADSLDVDENKVSVDSNLSKNVNIATLKLPASTGTSQKRGSIVLSTIPKSSEAGVGQLKVLPVVRQGSKDCIVLPTGKKVDLKNTTEEGEQSLSDPGTTPRSRNIKAIKVKSDSLPPSLLTAGKLKGQTIIHQKGGKYVIVTQPPQSGRQRTTPGKVQSGSKVVILTNQLGEQKIITTSGLQQSKFKVDGQKIIAGSDAEKEGNASTSVGQTQPVIKMVPDGKGGIMKQLTVSPKKVLVGGTKVLVSASGSTLASGNSVQKIALSSSGGVTRTASGDFRLIENYKGSGKTVLIQGGTSSTSGVVLKSSVMPKQVTKVIQSPQSVSALKKKPKILMRASSGQSEYVMQSASGNLESPTIVVKQKGSDGKFSTQKIVRTEIVNHPKVATSTPTKTFFVSGQGGNKKGESYLITTNESVPSKVIRMRPKIKEMDVSSPKSTQKIVQKSPEVYSIPENSLLISNQSSSESETSQIVQVPDQLQQTVLQTQVIAMPGPVGADGNQTYVLVSVDENGVVQGMDNSMVAFDGAAQNDQIFVNPTSASNLILLNSQANEEVTPVYSSSGQDILAEALANTNVLEGSMNNEIDTVVPSILLPPSIPSSVVQETSITLQKPIMTPLEMPSSVAADTSGLEPPPLPPTPTEEDVLMEDSELLEDNINQEQQMEVDKKEESTSNETIQTYIQSDNFESTESGFQVTNENQKIFEQQYGSTTPKCDETPEKKLPESVESSEGGAKPEFAMETLQEEQSSTSFQSLPVLNDEPDTSDDAQNSEPIPDQHFELNKPEQHSPAPREQEPPSSTNNEMITENVNEERFETHGYQLSETKDNLKTVENEENQGTEENSLIDCGQKEKEKENVTVTESHSLPVIIDESNTNSYDVDAPYSDVILQKRFQEETEVSSTTDEFSSKENGN